MVLIKNPHIITNFSYERNLWVLKRFMDTLIIQIKVSLIIMFVTLEQVIQFTVSTTIVIVFHQYNYKSEVLRRIEKGILFDANINSATYNYTPSRPAGVDDDYTWGGWYSDSGLNQAYSFDKMPSNDFRLYAKWVAPNMTVSFDLNGGEGTAPETQTVEKKNTATVVADPTRAHYDFDGWFTAKEGGERYVWSKQSQKISRSMLAGNLNLSSIPSST